MRQALEALTRMATLARQLGASRVEAVATSAVRDAANGLTFLELVRSETGLKVKILRGEEEARLSFRSALAHFELGVGRAVVMDIGGGSLELALSADGLLERLISLPFGAIRLTEEFLGPGTRRKGVRRLRGAIRDDIRKVLPVRDWRGAQVIGSGGTFTNLAGIYLMRQGVQTARTTHGTRLARVELEHILDMLQDMSPEQRAAVPGLNPGRADIIVAGFAVAAEVLAGERRGIVHGAVPWLTGRRPEGPAAELRTSPGFAPERRRTAGPDAVARGGARKPTVVGNAQAGARWLDRVGRLAGRSGERKAAQ